MVLLTGLVENLSCVRFDPGDKMDDEGGIITSLEQLIIC
jgi:hypothetical protein